MAALPNARHERFAQGLAQGKTADEAYQEAGFKPNRGNATRLKANESVGARVAELQGIGAERALVTIESLTQELDEARLHALKDDKGASAAVSAIMGKAKLHGLLIDKHEHSGVMNLTVSSEDAEL